MTTPQPCGGRTKKLISFDFFAFSKLCCGAATISLVRLEPSGQIHVVQLARHNPRGDFMGLTLRFEYLAMLVAFGFLGAIVLGAI